MVSAPGAATHLPAEGSETVGQVLAQVGVEPQEVGNIFLNGKLLPRTVYSILLGYQRTADEPLTLEEYLATPIRSGDRVGVFPRKMSSVVV
jgi:hypothetical protein